MTRIYLMGSMKNANVSKYAIELRKRGYEVFDDWMSPGPDADDHWQEYERQRGRTYMQALYGHHATTVFEFDKAHLDMCDIGILIMPCGKSGHMELGYLIGSGKQAYVLFDEEPARYDIMYRFATGVAMNLEELITQLELKSVKTKQVQATRRHETDTKAPFPKELRSSK